MLRTWEPLKGVFTVIAQSERNKFRDTLHESLLQSPARVSLKISLIPISERVMCNRHENEKNLRQYGSAFIQKIPMRFLKGGEAPSREKAGDFFLHARRAQIP